MALALFQMFRRYALCLLFLLACGGAPKTGGHAGALSPASLSEPMPGESAPKRAEVGRGPNDDPGSLLAHSTLPVAGVGAYDSKTDDLVKHELLRVGKNDPVWGRSFAPVTIVVFTDFQCPYCANLSNTLAELAIKYGPEKLRIVYRALPLPFHPAARPAAEYAARIFAERGGEAFWRFHDHAFSHQQELQVDNPPFERWCAELGIAPPSAPALRDWSAADVAAKYGISGTPTSFVNGVKIAGAQPLQIFDERVSKELELTTAMLEKKISPAQIYAARVSDNAGSLKATSTSSDEGLKKGPVYVRLPLGHAPMRGSSSALVTMVVFGDYQCPFCVKLDKTLKSVLPKYEGKVRLSWRHEPLPFHADARPAARLALYVRKVQGDDAFWRFHDALFQLEGRVEQEAVLATAQAQGLTREIAGAAMNNVEFDAQLNEDIDLAASVGARGTPTTFVNGRLVTGAQRAETFEEAIEEELKRAQVQLKKGTPRAKLYDVLVQKGSAPEPKRDKP